MQGNTAVGGREADGTAGQWLEVNTECDSGSEWQVVGNSNKGKKKMRRSCDSVNIGTTSASVPCASSVSLANELESWLDS